MRIKEPLAVVRKADVQPCLRYFFANVKSGRATRQGRSLATTVPEESNGMRGRSPKAVELPQDSAEAQRSSHARTRAADGALQLQERTAQTICSLPTIADPDTFPMNLAERGLYVRTLYRES